MKQKIVYLLSIVLLLTSCDKDVCDDRQFKIYPFIEKYGGFQCNGADEYAYVFRKSEQIESLEPNCFFPRPLAFPLDEMDMAYIMVGKIIQNFNDTLETELFKNTCSKVIIYEVRMIQRDTIKVSSPGPLHIFCSVDRVPEDYEVIIDYRYVPLE